MSHKQRGNRNCTSPQLPSTRIAYENSVLIEWYPRDHAPPHLHVIEYLPNRRTRKRRIGQMGKPLKGESSLSNKQAAVVAKYLKAIRKAVRKIARNHWYENL